MPPSARLVPRRPPAHPTVSRLKAIGDATMDFLYWPLEACTLEGRTPGYSPQRHLAIPSDARPCFDLH
jgi:hypothetical protein